MIKEIMNGIKERILNGAEYTIEDSAEYDYARDEFLGITQRNIKIWIACIPISKWRESAGITEEEWERAMSDDENAILIVQDKMEKFLDKFELYKFFIKEYGEKLYIGLFFVPK
jgi:hypothetical protein